MKTLFRRSFSILCVIVLCIAHDACVKKDPVPEEEVGEQLVGSPGNPRFNLQFTNQANVDLDLYVQDPTGEITSYGNPYSYSGGELDVDCLCGDCPQGPNENIFWPEDDSAPKGTYKFWVEYYDNCGNGSLLSSNYTVRVTNNQRIVSTYTGTVSSGASPIWTYRKD